MDIICPGLLQIRLGSTNVFLLQVQGDVLLIDAGPEDKAPTLFATLQAGGIRPTDIDSILVTHAHQDHAGGLKALKDATGAPVWMHSRDASLVQEGRTRRPWSVTPGPLHHILYWLYVRGVPETVPPVEIDHHIDGDQSLPFGDGLRAIHVPGHCAGQLAFLWPKYGGVLFAGDAALSVWGRPCLSIVYEDVQQGHKDLQRLSALDFETAVFGHGAPITEAAAQQFRRYYG